jgi:hypothetical protein
MVIIILLTSKCGDRPTKLVNAISRIPPRRGADFTANDACKYFSFPELPVCLPQAIFGRLSECK